MLARMFASMHANLLQTCISILQAVDAPHGDMSGNATCQPSAFYLRRHHFNTLLTVLLPACCAHPPLQRLRQPATSAGAQLPHHQPGRRATPEPDERHCGEHIPNGPAPVSLDGRRGPATGEAQMDSMLHRCPSLSYFVASFPTYTHAYPLSL